MREDKGLPMNNPTSNVMGNVKTMTMKMPIHHVEMTPGENGGMSVKTKYSREPGKDYDLHTEEAHFGPGQHMMAMEHAHKMMCSGKCGGDVTKSQPGAMKTGRSEKTLMQETNKKVGTHLASLGGKSKIAGPSESKAAS
jgi:hypothetical protein